MIESIHEATYGISEFSKMVSLSYANEIKFPIITKHVVALDLAPVAFIVYAECAEEGKNAFNTIYSMHPQSATRTIHELFRLIIEWAYSYIEFQNTEPMAELCHNILQILQMPKSVRDDLIAIRPQPVARYLLADTDALQEYDSDAEMPESFKLWISDAYYDYRERNKGFPININQSYEHLSYPM
jgi:hypothetical protein